MKREIKLEQMQKNKQKNPQMDVHSSWKFKCHSEDKEKLTKICIENKKKKYKKMKYIFTNNMYN